MINLVEWENQKWVVERQADCMILGYDLKNHLFSGKSEFQEVDIVETSFHGRMLFNDRLVMISEKDEFVYHDMICHVPMFIHPDPKNILIIGGGDGGTVREVLRHPSVEKCTMVEIDKMVVDACREFIPQTAKDLSHEKVDLRFEDGVKFVKETKEKYDVVIVDSSDPIGPATPLFGPEFYEDIYSILTDHGIVISQGESSWYNPKAQMGLLSIVNKRFPISMIYTFSNLTYPGGYWSFTYGSKKYHPIKDFNEAKYENCGLKFDYYNADVHRAAFSLPNFMKENLKGLIKVGSGS